MVTIRPIYTLDAFRDHFSVTASRLSLISIFNNSQSDFNGRNPKKATVNKFLSKQWEGAQQFEFLPTRWVHRAYYNAEKS